MTTKTYLVTATNLVDQHELEVAAQTKKEAISKGRRILGRREFISRYDGRTHYEAVELK